jgi:hypothetical protein
LLEWLRRQPAETVVEGYVDQIWNGLASLQLAGTCAALADRELFERARAEGAVHHLFEDPPISKYELLVLCARTFDVAVSITPATSGRPSTRVLGTRHRVLAEQLESLPLRAAALEALAERGTHEHG